MTGRDAVAIVARREIRSRLRERALLISTLVTLAILAAIVLLPKLLGSDGPEKVTVAAPPGLAVELAQAAQRGQDRLDVEVTVKRVRDEPAARKLVADGEADAAVVRGGTALLAGDPQPDEALGLLQAVAADAPPLPVQKVASAEDDKQKQLAFVAVILLYGQLIGYGFWVAAGVVEEKASRIVELLLAAIRPRDLLAGKVIGIGLVALGQLFTIGLIGLALGVATGDVSADARSAGSLAIVLAWFVLGYAFYACAFAAAGALVARQEDVQNVTTPITLLLLGSFFLSFPALDDPGGTLARVISFLPPAAPLVMPARTITGDASALEIVASVGITTAAAAGLVVLAGRVYAAGALQTTRLSLRSALGAKA